MEHKLILGGELWLPFARSRIKALRATGLPYAAQSFTMGDGSLVRVRIEPGIEYISIDGGDGGVIYMDSGVADLRSTNSANLLRFSPGIFYDSQNTKSYKAQFATVTPDGEFRLNKSSGKSGQMAGDLHGLTGYVQVDPQPPRSYAPLVTKNDDGTTTTSTTDESLAGKKISVGTFPASCFTGRMRKYVQAMYSEPLYDPQATGEDASKAYGGVSSIDGTVPRLLITYAKETPKPSREALEVNVSTGIVKTTDGAHWLVNVASDKLYILPLKASSAASRLRRYIADKSNTLSDSDKDKLESYILASSRPVASKIVVVPLGGAYPSFSMGYGWHWNWSGNTAVIVAHEDYSPGTVTSGGGPDTNVESTMFSMSLTPRYEDGGVKGWDVGIESKEGSVRWGLSRRTGGIAYPVIWNNALGVPPMAGKLNALNAGFLNADAPIYAYFAKDELVICRIKTSYNNAGMTQYSGTPNFSYIGEGASFTEGDRPGFRQRVKNSSYWDVSFSVGGDTYTGGKAGYIGTGAREETKNVARTSGPPDAWTSPFVANGGLDVNVGYPSSYDHIVIPHDPTPGSGGDFTAVVATLFKLSMDFETSEVSTGYLGKFDIIVPFNDAESIIVSNSVILRETRSGRTLSKCRSEGGPNPHGYWTSYWIPIPTGPTAGDLASWPHDDYLTMVFGSARGNITDSTVSVANEIVDSVIDDRQKIYTRAGAYDASLDIGFLTEYQTPALDTATPITTVIAGVAFDAPVIFSPHLIGSPLGVVDDTPDIIAPTILGWA